MKVMKFGGTSVKDAERIANVAKIIKAEASQVVVVLSAMKGVTDELIRAAKAAEDGQDSYREIVNAILSRHEAVASILFPDAVVRDREMATARRMGTELLEVVHGISLVRECTPRTMDLVTSFGERLSCRIVASYLPTVGLSADFVDARDCIVTDDRHGAAVVDFSVTYEKTRERLASVPGVPVVTGFIAATKEGVTTTLGRNGSDYTASIVGAAIRAERVEIWTDVDGVLSADPAHVPDAFVIDELSYQEAMELSYFGAEVLHPYTMIPAVETNTAILIKNTMNPAAPGTRIARDIKRHDRSITGIASIDNVALVNIEGGGMAGLPGLSGRIFSALARAGVNAVMISQASSEHSICIVLREDQADAATRALTAELVREIQSKQIQDFELRRKLEIVAVVGENMRGRPGISGRLFSALGDAGVNILAIAQGSSERNISFVIDGSDREKALRRVHEAFFGTG